MKTIKLTGGILGSSEMKIRCNLSNASSPVEVDYCEGYGWQSTQFQCADVRHYTTELAKLGQKLAFEAMIEPYSEKNLCEWEECE